VAVKEQFIHTTGKTCYVIITTPNDGQKIWNGATFEVYVTANYATYPVTATEAGTASGRYTFTIPALAEGIYEVIAYEQAGANPAETDTAVGLGQFSWDGSVISTGSGGASATDPLTNQVPANYPAGSAGWALGRIGVGRINTTSVIAQTGRVTVVRGDSYLTALGRALIWTDASSGWPDLTESSVTLEVSDGALVADGEIVTATGASKSVRVQLNGNQTNALDAGEYDYTVVVTFLGTGSPEEERVTLARGSFIVVDREDS
jgi:hypothetical protein